MNDEIVIGMQPNDKQPTVHGKIGANQAEITSAGPWKVIDFSIHKPAIIGAPSNMLGYERDAWNWTEVFILLYKFKVLYENITFASPEAKKNYAKFFPDFVKQLHIYKSKDATNFLKDMQAGVEKEKNDDELYVARMIHSDAELSHKYPDQKSPKEILAARVAKGNADAEAQKKFDAIQQRHDDSVGRRMDLRSQTAQLAKDRAENVRTTGNAFSKAEYEAERTRISSGRGSVADKNKAMRDWIAARNFKYHQK